MSCNFCELRLMRQRYGENRVTTRTVPEGERMAGWTEVLVDGVPRSWMQRVNTECAC